MFKRHCIKLIAVAFGIFSSQLSAQEAVFLGSYDWVAPGIGGISGIEVTAGGKNFLAITDRGSIVRGEFTRNPTGQITDIASSSPKAIKFFDYGTELNHPHSDSEGLAMSEDGQLFVSFEQITRVRGINPKEYSTIWIPEHPDFASFPKNSALEALAIDSTGALYMLAERSGGLNRPYPVYRVKNREWDIPFSIPRRGKFLPVGADFGPDGQFFLLERAFLGIWGFRSRVRVFEIQEDRILNEAVVLETTTSEHDNLEGISVWHDEMGRTRLTMVSDDNFFFLQQTKVVEYTLNQ